MGVDLRPAHGGDWPKIEVWLRQSEVQRWWGSHSAAQAEVLAALSSDMGLCSIIEVDGLAVGYAQAQEAQPVGEALPLADTAGTFRVDAFIGEAQFRARGVGREAIALVVAEIFATSLAVAAIVVVPLKYEAAVRAYEKSGFRWVRVIDDPLLGPSWLMRVSRR